MENLNFKMLISNFFFHVNPSVTYMQLVSIINLNLELYLVSPQ